MSYEDDPEAQWAPDPTGRFDYRYWDGRQWTGHVKNGGPLPTALPAGLRGPEPEASRHQASEYQVSEHQGAEHGASDLAQDDPFARAGGSAAAASGYGAGDATAEPDGGHDGHRYGDTRRSFWTGALVGGAVVLIAAVAVFVLVDQGTGTSDQAAVVTTTTFAPTTTLAPTTTTTLNPGRPPAQVRVRVINATGAGNLATQKMAQLTPLGYQNAGVADGTVRKGTAVQCRSGFELEAATLAKNVGGGAVVEPFPATPPAGSTNADCLVILGTA
jgi:LytR cell envelope-related transcriptional attenuator/uncharacterized protein DUF2510